MSYFLNYSMNKQLETEWEKNQIKQQKEDLKNLDVIYVIGLRKSVNTAWDAGIWRHFDIRYIKDNKLERVFFYNGTPEKPSLWNHEYRCFESHVLGSNRFHEIVYSLYTNVYDGDPNEGLSKMPRIEFLSSFDGDEDKQEEIERENLEELY